jgi:hypothetical protein
MLTIHFTKLTIHFTIDEECSQCRKQQMHNENTLDTLAYPSQSTCTLNYIKIEEECSQFTSHSSQFTSQLPKNAHNAENSTPAQNAQ